VEKLVDFSKYQLKKEPEIIPDNQDEKIIPGETKIVPEDSKKESEVKITGDKDFNIKQVLTELATESEFEILIYKTLFGKVGRGSNKEIERKLEVGLKKFRELFS